jgi:hypothetical protein
MAKPALWPQTPNSANESPYSRTLQIVDEEARGRHETKGDNTGNSKRDGSHASLHSSSSESSSDVSERCTETLCADATLVPENLQKLQKQQAWLRGGASQAEKDTDLASIHTKSPPKKRTRAPGVLETVFLPRTTAAKTRSTAMVRRHSTVEGSTKAPPVAPSSVAPSIRSQKTGTSARKDKRNSSILSFFGAPQTPAAPIRIECITCLADDIPIRRSAKLECGHRMCHSCLTRIFKLSTTDPQLMPPRCCTDNVIPLRHVDRLFEEDFKRLWNRKFAEYTTKNRLYCPSKGCGEWIKPKYIEIDRATGRRMGTCSKCKTKVCKKCNMRWHGNRECSSDDGTKRVIELGEENGWQRCYNCRTMVQLAEGCNHMRCHCNAEFCMVCGSKWKTCDCPWFNLPPEILRVHDYLIPGNGPHPPYPPFMDRRDMPLDPLNVPAMFRPPDLPPPPRPRARRARTMPGPNETPGREAQEAADEALARQLQEQELDTDFQVVNFQVIPVEEDRNNRSRQRAARRARRRVYAITEDQEFVELDPVAANPDLVREEPTGHEAAIAGLDGLDVGAERVENWRRHI